MGEKGKHTPSLQSKFSENKGTFSVFYRLKGSKSTVHVAQ